MARVEGDRGLLIKDRKYKFVRESKDSGKDRS
jgi:hypothetical protein